MGLISIIREKLFPKYTMRDVLKIMEFCFENNAKEVCTESNLKRRFGEEAYKKFSLFCMGDPKPYAREVQEDIGRRAIQVIKLTQGGIRKYFELGKEARRDSEQSKSHMWNKLYVFIFSLLVIFTAITSYASFHLSATQTQIQNDQLKLFETSTIPNGADLDFWTKLDLHKFSMWELNESFDREHSPLKIEFCLSNKGRIESGIVRGWGVPSRNNELMTIVQQIDNVPAGGFNCSRIDIRPNHENLERVESGVHELTVNFVCFGPCIEREWNETIKICLFGENSYTECES